MLRFFQEYEIPVLVHDRVSTGLLAALSGGDVPPTLVRTCVHAGQCPCQGGGPADQGGRVYKEGELAPRQWGLTLS